MFKQIHTGIDISQSMIKVAQIEKKGAGWILNECAHARFPGDTIRLSHRNPNVVNPDHFNDTIKKAIQPIKGRISQIGLSLPNEILKTMMYHSKDLPESAHKIEQMITWQKEQALQIPSGSLKLSFQWIKKDQKAGNDLLIVMGMRKIIEEYEALFNQIQIQPTVIEPASICELNFMSSVIEEDGNILYLGVFDNYLSFFIFSNGALTFCHGAKIQMTIDALFKELYGAMRHYLNLGGDRAVDKIYLNSKNLFHDELKYLLEKNMNITVHSIDVDEIINEDKDSDNMGHPQNMSQYTAAIGAAMSLL